MKRKKLMLLKIIFILLIISINLIAFTNSKKKYKNTYKSTSQTHKSKTKTKFKTKAKAITSKSLKFRMLTTTLSHTNSQMQLGIKSKIPHEIKIKLKSQTKFVKFLGGLAIGYGLKIEATEELKKCFIELTKKKKTIRHFINKAVGCKNKENNETKIEEIFKNEKKVAKSFISQVVQMFNTLKSCSAFNQTFWSFIKTSIISIGVKSLAYAVGGILAVFLKGTYNLVKLIAEIRNFYNERSKSRVDYYQLGSSVGKIIYYSQGLVFRRRR